MLLSQDFILSIIALLCIPIIVRVTFRYLDSSNNSGSSSVATIGKFPVKVQEIGPKYLRCMTILSTFVSTVVRIQMKE